MSKSVNRLIGQALGHYNMLADGDRVMVAVSGGIDSLVLAAVLDSWRRKAPINYELSAVYLEMGFAAEDAALVRDQLVGLNIPLATEKFIIPEETAEKRCFACARKRRNRLFALAKEKNFSKLAMGHHKDDIIETFFINLLYSGNLSTMAPRQELFGGRLAIIRPLAYLEKEQIIALGEKLGIKAIGGCPLAGDGKRQATRELLKQLYSKNKNVKASIFAALANVRREYLL